MIGRIKVHGWWQRAFGIGSTPDVGSTCESSSGIQAVCERTVVPCECGSCVEHLLRERDCSIVSGSESLEVYADVVSVPSNCEIVCSTCAERIRHRCAARFVALRAEAME